MKYSTRKDLDGNVYRIPSDEVEWFDASILDMLDAIKSKDKTYIKETIIMLDNEFGQYMKD